MMQLLRGWKFDEIEGKSSSTEKRISYLSPFIFKVNADIILIRDLKEG